MSGPNRQKYLRNAELREEIAYAVGGDPTEYGDDSNRRLLREDLVRIATQLQPERDDLVVEDAPMRHLYEAICEWVGGDWQPSAGNPHGLRRENLKLIHDAVGGRPPRETVSVTGSEGGEH